MVRIPIVFIILSTQLTYCLIKNNFFVCKPTLIGIDHNDNNHNQNYIYENIKNINMTSSHHNTSLPYIFPFPKIYKSNSDHIDNNKYKLSLYPKFYIHIIDNIKHDDDNESLDGGYETNIDQIEKILDRYCIESTYINHHYHHKYNNNNDIHSHSHHHHHEEAIQYYYIKNINIVLTSPLSLIEINDVMTTLLSNDRDSRGGKNNNNDSHHHHHSHDKSHHRHHDHNNNNNQNLLLNELYTLDININNNNDNHNVTITACGYRGIINAIMTLDQLLSASSPSSSSIALLPSIVSLPLSIIDWPDNIWRGTLVR